jgi:hypothetical protein
MGADGIRANHARSRRRGQCTTGCGTSRAIQIVIHIVIDIDPGDGPGPGHHRQ